MVSNPSAMTGFDQEQIGYKQSLSRRHVQMIAIGGAIGSGLFLGSAELLHVTGPALIITYILAGIIALSLMFALGELVLHRPTSGAFVSYTREFFGERCAYAVGWLYWLQWAVTGVVDLTAVGVYLRDVFGGQTWPGALLAFVLILSLNISSAKAFAEFEFFASMLKVIALVIFLVAGIVLVVLSVKVGDTHAGLANLNSGDGFWPTGPGHNWFYPVLILNSVLFSYIAIELVAVTAGEMEDAETEVPRAVKSVVFRILIFYIGSIFLLVCLLPTGAYKAGVSPFVTVARHLHSPIVAHVVPPILTAILITAALSALNSGVYSTGRILRSLGMRNQAPQFVTKLSKRGVPLAGIAFTASVFVLGIILNFILDTLTDHNPLFDIAQELGAISIIGVWISVFACQLRLRYLSNRGVVTPSTFRAPMYPFFSIMGICMLLATFCFCWWGGTPTGIRFGTGHDFTSSQIAVLFVPVVVIALLIGWKAVKPKVITLTDGQLGPVWPWDAGKDAPAVKKNDSSKK